MIAWSKLQNPVISFRYISLKDQCMTFDQKQDLFYILSSISFRNTTKQKDRNSLVFVTKDFLNIRPVEIPYYGSSPDISFVPHFQKDLFYITFQSRYFHPNPRIDKVYKLICDLFRIRQIYINKRTDLDLCYDPISRDFSMATFWKWIPSRTIDGSLLFLEPKFYLVFKRWQRPYISTSYFLISWSKPQKLNLSIEGRTNQWGENFQLLRSKERIFLVATVRKPGIKITNPYTDNLWPAIGEKEIKEFHKDPLSWNLRFIDIPKESWNQNLVANTISIYDHSRVDGFYYALYSGGNDTESFLGRGHNSIGIARSQDLVTWKTPPN